MGSRLTDGVFAQLCTQGYAIVPRYFPEQQRAAMAAALRRLLEPWDLVRDDPPANRRDSYYFPYPEPVLNRAIVDREAIAFARRWLGTEQIQYRPGLGLVTYPGARGGGDTAHIDNGNKLPPAADPGGPQPRPDHFLVLPRGCGRGSGRPPASWPRPTART